MDSRDYAIISEPKNAENPSSEATTKNRKRTVKVRKGTKKSSPPNSSQSETVKRRRTKKPKPNSPSELSHEPVFEEDFLAIAEDDSQVKAFEDQYALELDANTGNDPAADVTVKKTIANPKCNSSSEAFCEPVFEDDPITIAEDEIKVEAFEDECALEHDTISGNDPVQGSRNQNPLDEENPSCQMTHAEDIDFDVVSAVKAEPREELI